MKKGKYIVALIVLLTVLLSSCKVPDIPDKISYDEIYEEFSQYGQSDDVMISLTRGLYFHDHEIDLDTLFPGRSIVEDAVLLNNQIYLAVHTYEAKPYPLTLYSCDLYGENLKKVFEYNPNDRTLYAEIEEGVLYFQFQDSESHKFKIMTFDILAEELNMLSENHSWQTNHYVGEERPYIVQQQRGTFIITSQATGEQRVIDEAYLQKTEFYDSLVKFNHGICNHSVTQDKIMLAYHFNTTSFFDLTVDSYPKAIFEYDFENDKLIFKATAAPYDCEGYKIRHNATYDQP